jgi:hypothetical protein
MQHHSRSSEPNYLEQALEGLDPDTRARALEFVQKLGLSPDDPLFLFSIALKQFETIVLTAPQTWEDALTTLRTDLELWHQHQTRTLAVAEQMAEAIEEVTHSLTEQHALSSALLQASNASSSPGDSEALTHLSDQLHALTTRFDAWSNQYQDATHSLTELVSIALNATSKNPSMRSPAATAPFPTGLPPHLAPPSLNQPSQPKPSRSISILLGLLVSLTGATCFMVYQLRQAACKPSPQAHTWTSPRT